MPQSIRAPSRRLAVEPLNPTTFSPYGTVIENPLSSHSNLSTTLQSITANQGSARRWLDATPITNFYSHSPSKKLSRLTASLFVCQPRKLRKQDITRVEDPIRAVPNAYPTSWAQAAIASEDVGIFDVEILERHPFTSQTFIPLGLGKDDKSTQYLVIVAPTLPSSRPRSAVRERQKPYPTPDRKPQGSAAATFSRGRPAPYSNDQAPPTASSTKEEGEEPKGPGLPDLNDIRVFLANGSQAVTYGAGTWHAPMVVVGHKAVDFVVIQHVSGVPDEDCQEVVLESMGEGLSVALEVPVSGGGWARGKL